MSETLSAPSQKQRIHSEVADGQPNITARMSNVGFATLVELGYVDAERSDADKIYAVMAAADERRTRHPDIDDFAKLRQALSNASPGPWRHDHDHQMMIGSRHALMRRTGIPVIVGIAGRSPKNIEDGDDAAFMAVARNELPALLEAYDKLKAQLEASSPST
jgi:hypothetical protein